MKREGRSNLLIEFPCIKCSKNIRTSVFEVPIDAKDTRSSHLIAAPMDTRKEVTCEGCATKQTVQINMVVTASEK